MKNPRRQAFRTAAPPGTTTPAPVAAPAEEQGHTPAGPLPPDSPDPRPQAPEPGPTPPQAPEISNRMQPRRDVFVRAMHRGGVHAPDGRKAFGEEFDAPEDWVQSAGLAVQVLE